MAPLATTLCCNEARFIRFASAVALLLVVPSAGRVSRSRARPFGSQLGLRAAGQAAHNASAVSALQVDAVKPPKITVDRVKTEDKERFETDVKGSGTVRKCGVTEKVTSSSNKDDRCPEECPFFAQDRTDESFCTFQCVTEKDCNDMFPKTQIGDRDLGVCRSCMVDGCDECDISVTTDRCAKCQAGYRLQDDGTCHFKYGGTWVYVVGAIIGVLLLLVVLWVTDMAIRPTWNEEGMKEALDCREHMKIFQPDHRGLYPFGTNLHTEVVAGPGMMLHFNFQLAIIIWAFFVACVWMGFAAFVDEDLWRLGTRKYGTPRDNCILVAWGYETQQRLMWTKVSFLWIVYLGSFVGFMLYSIYQLRRYQHIDYKTKTMKDFAALMIGLPPIPGTRCLEEDLKKAMKEWSGEEIIGVSVAWNHKERHEEFEELINRELKLRSDDVGDMQHTRTIANLVAPPMNPIRSKLWNTEQSLFELKHEEKDEEEAQSDLKETLFELKACHRAVVVFETEEARDRAVEKAEAQGTIQIEDYEVELHEITGEPDTVNWENFGHVTPAIVFRKLVIGVGIILAACLFWAVVFYSPYAYYVLTFNYSNGRQPGAIVGMSFSMIVVVGNAIMYEVCGRIADWVGFRFRDQREMCYMVLYTIACMFNVALDFVTTYITAETIMDELGFRTYFGEKFKDIDTFTVKFETYGMQRTLAENTFTYAFPSTFLIPFLIEWLPTMAMPYLMGKLIVKSHPEVRGMDAEAWLEMLPMDMGRYADILLNVILGILIFYFPGGYTWTLFLGMAVSHIWIYAFDYYKVLRQIPAVHYVEFDVEWACQAMLAPIIGIIAASLMFKSNCEAGYPHCVQGPSLIVMCFLAWLGHTALQLGFLVYILPKCKVQSKDAMPKGVTYKDVAAFTAGNWFNCNPIHCMRSKYFYAHDPPCDPYRCGKEHLLRMNPEVGCFLTLDKAAQTSARNIASGSTPRKD